MRRLMNRLFALVTMLALLACSTPTGAPYDSLLESIRNMPSGSLLAAKREEARWRALEELRSNRDPDSNIGDIECVYGDPQQAGHGATTHVTVRLILDCLAASQEMTFSACVDALVSDARLSWKESGDAYDNAHENDDCTYFPDPDFVIDTKWNPANIDEKDLARTAIQSSAPPAWMIAAGIVVIGAGGAVILASGWGAVLCPLGADYGCPQAPDGSGTVPGGSASSGGDR